MPVTLTIPSEPPFPHQPPVPPIGEPGPRLMPQPPTVYMPPAWEYRVLQHAPDALPTEDEMNALGADGWELAAVVPAPAILHYYFKRTRD